MSQRPRKFQRISKACLCAPAATKFPVASICSCDVFAHVFPGDFCNRRSIKCNKNSGPVAPCQNCADFGVPCTYDRPTRRRGARKHDHASPVPPGPLTGSSESGSEVIGKLPAPVSRNSINGVTNGLRGVSIPSLPDSTGGNPWKAFAAALQGTILDLAQVYLEIVYPIFPLFHWPSFTRALENLDYLKDEGLFASTMAMCALASARARDGALYSNHLNSQQLASSPSEAFWSAAKESIPRDLSAAKDTEYMRTCAILSIASIQNGQIQDMQKYLGMYHTLAVMDGLYDEKLWPKDLDPVVVEIRRRLFWSIYTLDVYSSIVWGGIIRHREAQSNVRYPGDLRDEFISRNDTVSPASVDRSVVSANRASNDWIVGWNFTTDMYRILQHALDSQRRRSPPNNGTAEVWSLFRPAQMAGPWLMEHVLAMYSALPPPFREARPAIGDISHDIYGFQSANIQATLQLLRMVIYSSEEQGVDGKCDVAGQVLSVFSKVPVEYLKAISSPLLHHLAGIGYILGSVMEGSLSESSYQRVRALLLEMADLLHRLESGLRQSTGTSERLRAQVGRIDEYMATQRTSISNIPSAPAPALAPAPAPPRPLPIHNTNNVNPVQPDLISPVYQQENIPPIQTPLAGLDEPITYFQLPPELLDDWPWPFDASVNEGMFPPAFIK